MMSEFVENLNEVFSELGAIQARPMFGGHGIYYRGLMFALVADSELFLKVDEQTVGFFTDLGLEAFTYNKNGKPVRLSYHRAPEEIFDDPQQAKLWGQRACEAALRASRLKHASSKQV